MRRRFAAAGISLDKRVSFSVENADREKLLDALLTPAGLEYRIDGEQIRVRRSGTATNDTIARGTECLTQRRKRKE